MRKIGLCTACQVEQHAPSPHQHTHDGTCSPVSAIGIWRNAVLVTPCDAFPELLTRSKAAQTLRVAWNQCVGLFHVSVSPAVRLPPPRL